MAIRRNRLTRKILGYAIRSRVGLTEYRAVTSIRSSRYIQRSSAHNLCVRRLPIAYGTHGNVKSRSRRGASRWQLAFREPCAAKTRYATSRRSTVSPSWATTPSDHLTRTSLMRPVVVVPSRRTIASLHSATVGTAGTNSPANGSATTACTRERAIPCSRPPYASRESDSRSSLGAPSGLASSRLPSRRRICHCRHPPCAGLSEANAAQQTVAANTASLVWLGIRMGSPLAELDAGQHPHPPAAAATRVV